MGRKGLTAQVRVAANMRRVGGVDKDVART